MNKQEFLSRLDHLLSDISPEERADALTFYENYFEDAGPENEATVIHELGSPEKVAVSIKKNLAQSSGTGQDSFQYQESSAQQEFQGSASQQSTYQEQGDTQFHYNSYQETAGSKPCNGSLSDRIKRKLNEWQFYREHRTFCIVMFIAILVMTIPAWGSLLGGILGVVFGILGALVGIIAACFTLAITGIVVGIGLISIGIASLAAAVGPGLFLIGLGLLSLALGSLFTLATGELCGRFLPWSYRSIRDLIQKSRQSIGGAAA